MAKFKCECNDCKYDGTWRQLFGERVVRLCPAHHAVLRIRVPFRYDYDEDVLEWLKTQGTDPDKVMEYPLHLIWGKIRVKQE